MSTSESASTTPTSTSPGGLPRRLGVYFRTMFPLHANLPTALLMFFGFYLTAAIVRGEEAVIGWELTFAAATIFLSLLMLRTFDELKDEGVDEEAFPDRPLVTGAVRYSDVRILGLLSMLALLALNVGRGAATDAFLIFFVFAVLSWQWWFFPDVVSPSFTLTFVTHQPLVPLQFFYIYAAYLYANGASGDVVEALSLCLTFWTPFIVWELGRKIRAPEQEDAYLSYTKRWGTRRATVAVVMVLVLSGATAFVFGWAHHLAPYFGWGHGIAAILAALVVLRFLRDPCAEKNHVKTAVEGYVVAFYLLPILQWWLEGGAP